MIDFPYHKICYSVSGAEDATDYSRSYIYEQIRTGRLKAYKRGGRTFIKHEELKNMIEEDAERDLAKESAA